MISKLRLPAVFTTLLGVLLGQAALATVEWQSDFTIAYDVSSYGPDAPFPVSAPGGATPWFAFTVTDIVRGPGIQPAGLTTGFSANEWHTVATGSPYLSGTRDNAIFSGLYYQFSVGVNTGYTASFNSFDTNLRRSTTSNTGGPRLGFYEWQYSMDGGANWSVLYEGAFADGTGAGAGLAMPTIDLSTIGDFQDVAEGTVITFRVYSFGGTPSNTNTFALGRAQDSPYDGSVLVSALNPGGGPLITGVVVPEPATIALLLGGLAVLLVTVRRRRG
jgi:hypothetical protein